MSAIRWVCAILSSVNAKINNILAEKRKKSTCIIYQLQLIHYYYYRKIIATNQVDDENEIRYLSAIMEEANISSTDGYYEKLMHDVCQ